MKRILLMSAAAMASAALSSQTVKTMSDLKPEQKSMAISLKLTGRQSAEPKGDYRQMRDLCFQVRTIDLGDAQSTEIPKNAFHSRHQLENIVLPKALKNIGTQAFFACDKLQAVTIPASVDTIGAAAFYYCNNTIARSSCLDWVAIPHLIKNSPVIDSIQSLNGCSSSIRKGCSSGKKKNTRA